MYKFIASLFNQSMFPILRHISSNGSTFSVKVIGDPNLNAGLFTFHITQMPLASVLEPSREKENSELKTTALCLKIDLVSHLLAAEGLDKHIDFTFFIPT